MAAIERGEEVTGVSLMLMDPGIDSGPVISQERVVVYDNDTTESLSSRLATWRPRRRFATFRVGYEARSRRRLNLTAGS